MIAFFIREEGKKRKINVNEEKNAFYKVGDVNEFLIQVIKEDI